MNCQNKIIERFYNARPSEIEAVLPELESWVKGL